MAVGAGDRAAAVREAGLGAHRHKRSGRVRLCRLEPQALSVAEHWINQRRNEWEQRLDRLGEYLNSLKQRGDSDEHGK